MNNNSISTSGFITLAGAVKPWNFCPHCGKKLEAAWKFCSECGEAVGYVAAPSIPWSPIYPIGPATIPQYPVSPIWQIPSTVTGPYYGDPTPGQTTC